MMLHFVDIHPLVASALAEAFAPHPEVSVQQGNILAVAENTIVSPANSYGFMDGGIDAEYVDFFGMKIQVAVQDAIGRRPNGLLPIGACVVVSTGHKQIPFMAVAPTMETPEAVPAFNAYRALRAVLREVGEDPEVGSKIYCPGLCTLTGRVEPALAAGEMARAYSDWKASRHDQGQKA